MGMKDKKLAKEIAERRMIPAGFKEFGYNAFTGTAWLRAKKQENPFVVVNDILICADGQNGDVSVPAGVKGIGEYVFSCESDKLPAEAQH